MKICNKCDSSMSLWCDADIKQLKTDRANLKAENEQLKDLLASLYTEVSYEWAGEWVIDNKILQRKIRQVLDGE